MQSGSKILAGVLVAVSLLAGCQSVPKDQRDPRDPFESVNRSIYKFNDAVDRAVMRPTARAYRTVVPQFVRNSVGNFFSNINDVRVVLNNTLQGKFTTAYADFGRIMINSTLGIVGLFDIASEAGIEKHNEDFGQTLGWYGMNDGPYIMLPLFGPSTVRDTLGFGVDYLTDPITYVDPSSAQNAMSGTRFVQRRADLLDASNVLKTTLDPYQFMRDAYLQRRRNLVYDGNPPPDKDDAPLKPDSVPLPKEPMQ
ncbi:MAG: transporter [Betaproteobacteria bacterium]|jgi:phospholipid-binding lipoprotein MlaA|nr:transporter [Betaproteobacteria bacterium]